jgi:hypothetical protein
VADLFDSHEVAAMIADIGGAVATFTVRRGDYDTTTGRRAADEETHMVTVSPPIALSVDVVSKDEDLEFGDAMVLLPAHDLPFAVKRGLSLVLHGRQFAVVQYREHSQGSGPLVYELVVRSA